MSDLPGAENSQPPAAPPSAGQLISVRLPADKTRVATVLLGVTVAVYALQFLSDLLFQVDIPAALGMKTNTGIQAGQLWRLFTPMLLHGSILHIGFNMYALKAIGPGLERYYGKWRFLALYVLAGFTGNVASFLLTQKNSLGASTAIFGLVAAEGIFIYRNRMLFGKNAKSMLANILGVVAINLVLGLSPGIDNWGHLGGLLGGAAFAWLAGPVYRVVPVPLAADFQLQDQVPSERTWQVAGGVGALFAIGALVKILLS